MKTFEYLAVTIEANNRGRLIPLLNEYGNKGWELILMESEYKGFPTKNHCLFKREKIVPRYDFSVEDDEKACNEGFV